MSRGLRLALAATLIAVLGLSSVAVVSAHARYASSIPASNATVSAAPSSVAITFTEELASAQISITGPNGSEVTTARATIDLANRTNASVPLKDDGPGMYTVLWKNVSEDDGDPNDGSFVFMVAGAAPAQPAAAPAAAAPETSANAPAASAPVTCVENGKVTPGISDVRVNTYCKRQAIRDKFKGQIDEKTFNFDLADGVGLDNALAEAMEALKGH
jgi:copper resistance protein C